MQTTSKFSNTYSLVELALHLDLKLHLDFEASLEKHKNKKRALNVLFFNIFDFYLVNAFWASVIDEPLLRRLVC